MQAPRAAHRVQSRGNACVCEFLSVLRAAANAFFLLELELLDSPITSVEALTSNRFGKPAPLVDVEARSFRSCHDQVTHFDLLIFFFCPGECQRHFSHPPPTHEC